MSTSTLKTGQKIPDLSGIGTDGEISLRKLKGKFVVVYFYPKDSTPGCTTQAQNFRDLQHEFSARNAVVIGVSRDSLKSHANFKQKQNLPFQLIADPDETWCKAFDVIHEKVMYGRHYLGLVRSTFAFNAEGKLINEWRGVKIQGHVAAVLEALDTARR